MKEAVNHPPHYGGDTTYEAIKVIEAWGLGFCLGNAVTYICRMGKKSSEVGVFALIAEVEDLHKAAWYINRRIEQLKAEIDGDRQRQPTQPEAHAGGDE